MVLSDEDNILIKKFVFEGVYAGKRLTDEFPEKSSAKRNVIISCCKRSGTQAQLTGSQAAADRAVPAAKKIAMPSNA